LSLAAAYYVFLIGILLPALCVRSYFKVKAGAPFPAKSALRKQTLLMLGLLFLLAWITWRSFGLPLFPGYVPRWRDAGLGVGTLLIFVGAMYPVWRIAASRKREQIYKRLPQAPGEMGLWTIVSLTAGFVEEIVYRGVLFGILMYWLKDWWTAVLLCALAFAMGHAIQGWKSTAIIFVMSIIFHGLVRLTGTLYIAMVVHASYDIVAGLAYVSLYQGQSVNDRPATQT
jgi:membrane protease YdiL (CAAX protease family)